MSEKTQSVKETTNVNTEEKVIIKEPNKPTESSKQQQQSNNMSNNNQLKVVLTNKDRVEIINTNTGQRSMMVPATGVIKLNNTNVYNVPISNKDISLDSMNAVKVLQKFAEFFQILGVNNGFVTLKVVVNGMNLKHDTIIGSII